MPASPAIGNLRVVVRNAGIVAATAATAVVLFPVPSYATTAPPPLARPHLIQISRTQVLSGPHVLRPGATALHVTGQAHRRILLFQAIGQQSRAKLASDLNTFTTTGIPTPLLTDFIPSSGANSGSTMFLRLRPGRYFAVVPHVAQLTGQGVFPIAVRGARAGRSLPRPTTTFRPNTAGTAWASAPRTMKTKGVLALNNSSTVVHEVVVAPMRSGVTLASLKSALSSGAPLTSYLKSANRVHLGAIAPKRTASLRYRIPAGTYAVLDFWPDSSGAPHANQGMVRTVTVH